MVDASRVETPEARCHVEALERPVAVDDSIAVAAAGPLKMPGVGSIHRGLFEPIPVRRHAPTTGETFHVIAARFFARIGGEKLLCLPADFASQAVTDTPSPGDQLVETPIRMDASVDDGEGLPTETSHLDKRARPKPIEPAIGCGPLEDIAEGVLAAQGAQPRRGAQESDLVVSEHIVGAAVFDPIPKQAQGAKALGPAIDDVANHPQLEVDAEAHLQILEEVLELTGTALNVAHEDLLHPAPSRVAFAHRRSPQLLGACRERRTECWRWAGRSVRSRLRR